MDPQGAPVGWSSSMRWEDQPTPLVSDPPGLVPEPFRGHTISVRHPVEPPPHYTDEERRLLCPLCRVPEIHRGAHRAGQLHRARESAAAARDVILRLARIENDNLARALALVRRLRPELLRAPSPPPDVAIDIDEDL